MEWLNYWHWVGFGLLLLIFEALGAAGFLVGFALASILLAVILAVDPMLGWRYQLLVFSLFSLIFTMLFWRFFRKPGKGSDAPLLNERSQQLVGRKLSLTEPMINRQGRVQIGDTVWKVASDEDIDAGVTVEVVSAESSLLHIRKVDL